MKHPSRSQVQSRYQVFQIAPHRPLSTDGETNLRPSILHDAHCLYEVGQSLLRPEIAQCPHHEAALTGTAGTRREPGKVDTVGDDCYPVRADALERHDLLFDGAG